MRRWSYGINSFHKKATIYIEDGSFFIFAIDNFIEFICDHIPPIGLPDIKINLKNNEDIEFNDGNKQTTLRDWYGDLRELFHLFVHVPIFDYCNKRINVRSLEIEYEEVKRIFYNEDKKFWDEEIKNCKSVSN